SYSCSADRTCSNVGSSKSRRSTPRISAPRAPETGLISIPISQTPSASPPHGPNSVVTTRPSVPRRHERWWRGAGGEGSAGGCGERTAGKLVEVGTLVFIAPDGTTVDEHVHDAFRAVGDRARPVPGQVAHPAHGAGGQPLPVEHHQIGERTRADVAAPGQTEQIGELRSEEHTSELQSRENLVCRLPPEKK